jgi:hypothetical protein
VNLSAAGKRIEPLVAPAAFEGLDAVTQPAECHVVTQEVDRVRIRLIRDDAAVLPDLVGEKQRE